MTPPVGASRASMIARQADAIPDSEDLHARYDFAQEDGYLPITDQTGNGHDLDNGQYTGTTATINGVQAGEFDGVDDYARTTFTSVSQPLTIAFVFQPDEVGADAGEIRPYDGGSDAEMTLVLNESTPGYDYRIYAGSGVDGGDLDNNPTISVGVFNQGSSIHRINGSQIASGDVGSNSLSGIILANYGDLSREMDINIGEMLIYNGDKSSKTSDIEQYLADKWGVSLN